MNTSEDELLRLKIARDAYSSVFNSGPYTTFNMMQYLLQRQRITWAEYLNNPDILTNRGGQDLKTTSKKAKVTNKEIRDYMVKEVTKDRGPKGQEVVKRATESMFNNTWNLKTGRCTSFALAVVDFIERMSPDPKFWDFRFYDLSQAHRVARCAKSGMLIDSSSKRGPLILKENTTWTTIEEGDNQSWQFSSGISNFQVGGAGGKSTTGADMIDRKDCMAVCLIGSLDTDILCFFRSFDKGISSYHAMLKWKIKTSTKKTFTCEYRGEKLKRVTFTWPDTPAKKIDEKDLIADREKFGDIVINFIDKFGGPHGHMQWNSGSIQGINWDIYEAAVKLWGFPTIAGDKELMELTEEEKAMGKAGKHIRGPSGKE